MRRVSEWHMLRNWNSVIRRVQETGQPVAIDRRDGEDSVVLMPEDLFQEVLKMARESMPGADFSEDLWGPAVSADLSGLS